jgi:hypothetical protein
MFVDVTGNPMAPEPIVMRILRQVQVPTLHDSAWLGPFEQLVGAAFSLLESEKRGFSRRKYNPMYHPFVQRKIVSLLQELEACKKSRQQDALDDWLSRYYFNSGIQRVNFAAERLIATFALCRASVVHAFPRSPSTIIDRRISSSASTVPKLVWRTLRRNTQPR